MSSTMTTTPRRRWPLFTLGSVGLLGLATAALHCSAQQRPDGGTGMLSPGAQAPSLTSPDQNGETVDLRALSSKGKVLVYFYPRDATPGCTKEACAFRDAWEKYQKANITVLGVSNDSVESHKEFAKDESLPFSLISDESGAWAQHFGVKTTLGLYARVSFLLDQGGSIKKVYEDVDPAQHADEVLRDAR